jgi:beta-glucosidase-like glycosyl hydrolase
MSSPFTQVKLCWPSRKRAVNRPVEVPGAATQAALNVASRFKFQPIHLNSSSSRLGWRPTYRTQRQVARECVRESLVLLKNENHALPLSRQIKRLRWLVRRRTNLGVQYGGWTIAWHTLPENGLFFQVVCFHVSLLSLHASRPAPTLHRRRPRCLLKLNSIQITSQLLN